MTRRVFLSRFLRRNMPAYNGEAAIDIQADGDMGRGSGTNSLKLSFKNHLGTHIDFPRHFWADGKTLNDYPADCFFFGRPQVLDIPLEQGRTIGADDLRGRLGGRADLLVIRTGYGKFYGDEKYWNDNPGLDESAAAFLKKEQPALRCLGVDFLSINANKYKAEGRQAHRLLLAPPEILIIEDLDLTPLGGSGRLKRVMVSPLLVDGADGVPVTVFAELE